MKTHTNSAPLRHNIFAGPGPQIMLAPDDGGGAGGDDDAAVKAAAEKASADAAKAAADKAAADKAAAEKAEKDGDKSKLSDEAAKLLKENMEKKAALKEAQDKIAEFEKRYEGIDPTEVRALLDAKKAAEKKALEDKGDFDRVKTMMADEHKKELEKIQAERDAANTEKSSLAKTINDLTVGQAFLASEFIKENLVLTPAKTRVIYGAHFEIENGQVIGYDKPAGAAERTKLVDASGSPLNFEAALERLIEKDPERDQVKKSKMAQGSGAKGSETAKKPKPSSTGLVGASRIESLLAARKAK